GVVISTSLARGWRTDVSPAVAGGPDPQAVARAGADLDGAAGRRRRGGGADAEAGGPARPERRHRDRHRAWRDRPGLSHRRPDPPGRRLAGAHRQRGCRGAGAGDPRRGRERCSLGAMSYDNIIDDGAAPVRTVTVNRPKVLNALDARTLEELTAGFQA